MNESDDKRYKSRQMLPTFFVLYRHSHIRDDE